MRPFLPQDVSFWYKQGANITATDQGSISGLTASCAGANSMSAELEVFPGQGTTPDAMRNLTGGLTNITVVTGQFLDSVLGVGGTGPTTVSLAAAATAACLLLVLVLELGVAASPLPHLCPCSVTLQANFSCDPGEVVTGVHVAWEPSPVPPYTNVATGVRIYCADPNTCAPIDTGNVTAASTAPPTAPPTPPAPDSNYTQLPTGVWSGWIGPVKGPPYYGGICPCNTIMQASGAACMRSAACSGADCSMPAACPGCLLLTTRPGNACRSCKHGTTPRSPALAARRARWRASRGCASGPTTSPPGYACETVRRRRQLAMPLLLASLMSLLPASLPVSPSIDLSCTS